MTEIGLKHYGGTNGLFEQTEEEQVRVLAFYIHRGTRKKP